MPIFVCDKCHGMDNSACGGNYWDRLMHKGKERFVILCCECYTGAWHGKFEKRIYKPGDENRAGGIDYIPDELKRTVSEKKSKVKPVSAEEAAAQIVKQFGSDVRVLGD